MRYSAGRGCVCLALVGGWAFLAGGCGSSNTTKGFGASGPPPSCQTLARVKAGKTTRQWVITALGEPTRTCDQAGGKELLTYEYEESVESSLRAPFISANEATKTRHSLYFEVENGVVDRFWHDRQIQDKRSSLN